MVDYHPSSKLSLVMALIEHCSSDSDRVDSEYLHPPRILVLGFYVARRTFKALVIIIGTVHPYYLITFWLAIEVWSTTITIIRNS
jgi:hypothetical protein